MAQTFAATLESPGKSPAQIQDRWWAAGLSLGALVLYVATLAPTVATVFDDSLEFQVVLPTLGIAHPTGYPLYTIAGWLFSLIPIGDAAFRINLFSAVAGAVTIGLLFLAARLLGASRLAAAVVSVIYAISSTWWSQATIAEVYTLHGLFVALILVLTLQGSGTRAPWLALVFGLSLAHHRMTLLLIPGVVVYLLWNDPGVLRQPRRLSKLGLAFLAPLLLYLYLPLRGQMVTALDGSEVSTWEGFWRHVLAQDYGAFLSGNPLAVERTSAYAFNLFASQVGLAGLLLGVLGWLRWGEQPRRWTMLALVFLANVLFAIRYQAADVDVFYLPATMVWLLVAASGLTLLQDSLAAMLASIGRRLRLPGPYKAWLGPSQVILVGVLLLQPLAAALESLTTSPRPRECSEVLAVGETPAFNPNRSGEWSVFNCAHAMLDLPLQQGSALVGLLGETTLIRYFQMAEDLRTDINLVTANDEAVRLDAVAAQQRAGRAVYVTRELAGLPERYSLTALGPLVRVWPAGQVSDPPALAEGVDISFGEAARLVGYEFGPVVAQDSTWLRVQLAWQTTAPISEELKVSVRLLDATGNVVTSADRVPVQWAYPTPFWRTGETIIDSYDFAFPEQMDTSALAPLIILYRAADGSELGRFQPSG